jgi:hypothetical protein
MQEETKYLELPDETNFNNSTVTFVVINLDCRRKEWSMHIS